MQKIHVQRSALCGELEAPPSKSHSLRAILLASLASGKSVISNVLSSPDIVAMTTACEAFGAHIKKQGNTLTIHGVNGSCNFNVQDINAGNSGQVLRFIAAIASTQSRIITITGDRSICERRPIKPYIDALPQVGARCYSVHGNQHAPVSVQGPWQSNEITVQGQDSQIISGLCMAAVLNLGQTIININDAGEIPWLHLTLDWLQNLGVKCINENDQRIIITGKVLSGFEYVVPGDFSSAAFPAMAALITNSSIKLSQLNWRDSQGDKALFYALQSLGAPLMISAQQQLKIEAKAPLLGGELSVDAYIDAVPILAVMGCFCQSPLMISDAGIARFKESDRLAAIAAELSKMGAQIKLKEDGLVIYPSQLKGAQVDSHHDHRIAMALAVAGMAATNETIITNSQCIQKSYPNFISAMQSLGVSIGVVG